MKQMELEDIVSQHETSGVIMYHSTITGDYKPGNREAKKLLKLFQILEKDMTLADACIARLMQSNCIAVRLRGVEYALSLQRNIPAAEQLLEEMSVNESYGIYRFIAEMTLKLWREKGYMYPYKK